MPFSFNQNLGLARLIHRIYGNIPGAAAEEAQRLVTGAAERLKQQAGDLYEAVKTVDTPPVMTPDGVGKITQELLDTIPEFMA